MADSYGWKGEEKPGLFTLYKSHEQPIRMEGKVENVDIYGGARKIIDQQLNDSQCVRENVTDLDKQRSYHGNMLYESFLKNVKAKIPRMPNLVQNCEVVQNKIHKITKILRLDNRQRYKASLKTQCDSIIQRQRKKNVFKTQSFERNSIFLSIEAIKQKYFKGKKCKNLVQPKKNSDYQGYKAKGQRTVVKKVLKINDFFKLNEGLDPEKQEQVVQLSFKRQKTNTNKLKYLIVGDKKPYICTDRDRDRFVQDKEVKDLKYWPQIYYQRSLKRQRSPKIKFVSQRLKSEGRVSDFRQTDDNSLQLDQAKSKRTLNYPTKIVKYNKNATLINGHRINLI